jgi:hypothetical protein
VQDVIVGVLAVLVGAMFCFRGYLAMRVIIPIWGAFAGFLFGAGLVSSIGDDRFLGDVLGWVVGLACALLFSLVAYLYYEIAVLFAMAAIGFALGTSVMVALDVTWSWLVILAGVLVATLLAVVAIVGRLPMILLVVLSAFAGASAIITGLMLLFGTVETAEFTSATVTETLEDSWWWYAVYVGLVVAGIISQFRLLDTLRGSLRDSWVDAGGREIRHSDA